MDEETGNQNQEKHARPHFATSSVAVGLVFGLIGGVIGSTYVMPFYQKYVLHQAPGADVEMAHFRIAHLPGRQADKFFRGVDQGMRIIAPERIPIGLASRQNRVEIGTLAVAEAIQNEQQNRGDVH